MFEPAEHPFGTSIRLSAGREGDVGRRHRPPHPNPPPQRGRETITAPQCPLPCPGRRRSPPHPLPPCGGGPGWGVCRPPKSDDEDGHVDQRERCGLAAATNPPSKGRPHPSFPFPVPALTLRPQPPAKIRREGRGPPSMATRFRLNGHFMSGPTYKVALMLALSGEPFAFHLINLAAGDQKAPDYRAKARFGQVPCLEDLQKRPQPRPVRRHPGLPRRPARPLRRRHLRRAPHRPRMAVLGLRPPRGPDLPHPPARHRIPQAAGRRRRRPRDRARPRPRRPERSSRRPRVARRREPHHRRRRRLRRPRLHRRGEDRPDAPSERRRLQGPRRRAPRLRPSGRPAAEAVAGLTALPPPSRRSLPTPPGGSRPGATPRRGVGSLANRVTDAAAPSRSHLRPIVHQIPRSKTKYHTNKPPYSRWPIANAPAHIFQNPLQRPSKRRSIPMKSSSMGGIDEAPIGFRAIVRHMDGCGDRRSRPRRGNAAAFRVSRRLVRHARLRHQRRGRLSRIRLDRAEGQHRQPTRRGRRRVGRARRPRRARLHRTQGRDRAERSQRRHGASRSEGGGRCHRSQG